MKLSQWDLGFKSLVNFRPNKHDQSIIKEILIDRTAYHFFIDAHPRVIFDVGANIGAASILYARTYPNALIFSFEPDPENFEILKKNTESYEQVKIFNYALGAVGGTRELYSSDDDKNHGGFSFHQAGSDISKRQAVQVKGIVDVMHEHHVEKIDLIKIDTEGCEYEILHALEVFKKLPDFICGEAHGVQDWRMFEILSASHLISVKKDLGQRCYPFYASAKIRKL